MKCLAVLLTFLVVSGSVKLPPNFKKCNRKDPNWKKCALDAGIDGLRQLTKPFDELNIPNLEPFFVPEITVQAGSNAVQLVQHFENIKIYGLTNSTVEHFDFDFEKKIIKLEGTFPEIRLPGDYKFDGKVLLLPIIGEGSGETDLKNVHAKIIMKFDEVKKRGKTYIKVVSSDLKFTPEHIHFRFDNLFNGDKLLGDNINQVLNDNWEAVYEDVAGAYTEVVKKIFISLINNFFSKVSIEEAFD